MRWLPSRQVLLVAANLTLGGACGFGAGREGAPDSGGTPIPAPAVDMAAPPIGAGGQPPPNGGGDPSPSPAPPPDAGAPLPPPSVPKMCLPMAAGTPPVTPVFRIPLRVHRTRSAQTDDQLCRVLEEVNRIWWTQAGICFEMTAVRDDPPMAAGLDFYFERATPFPNGVVANGVYSGPHTIYGLDVPSLTPAPTPAMNPAARTAAHELGHALGLQHQNPDQEQNCLGPGTECDDLLMRSGHSGYKITLGAPANVNERDTARKRAPQLALPDTGVMPCGAAILH